VPSLYDCPQKTHARCQGGGGGAAAQLRRVTDAIESGGWWQQFGAVALLRLTPVVPFRYVPGFTPSYRAERVGLPAQLPCLFALHQRAAYFAITPGLAWPSTRTVVLSSQ